MKKNPPETPPAMDPKALSIDNLAGLLSKAGGRPIGPGAIRADVAAGAPTNADGTLNLLLYAAWLARESE